MHKKYSRFLIVSFIVMSLLGVYSYFYNDLKSEASTHSSTSPLISSLNTGTLSAIDVNKTNEDIAFLVKLASLTSIKIDTSLFTDPAFNLLVDNNIKLEPVPYGRTNPFSPTSDRTVPSNVRAISLLVNPATLVTNKSAVLSGSLNGATASAVYFEYGATTTFGKTTPRVTLSLVGDFASSVTVLVAKTEYFYRAVANINGTLVYSEVMSFTTN